MPRRKTSRKPDWQLRIGKERIEKLLASAEKYSKTEPILSRKHLKLAIKIGMRYNIRLDKRLKKRICKKCFSFLIPGENSIVRTSPKQQALISTCKNCGSVRRFPYRREKKIRKRSGF